MELPNKSGIDYKQGLDRFMGNTALYEKFINKFSEDENYSLACKDMENKDIKSLFEHIHAMKGVSGNLSMGKLYKSCCRLVSAIRAEDTENLTVLFDSITKNYNAVVEAIKLGKYKDSEAMRPLVGIVPIYDPGKDSYWMLPGYMKGIEMSGGVPVMLPLTDDASELEYLVKSVDGLLFTGGDDIGPSCYGAEDSGKNGFIYPLRDRMETKLFELALKYDKSVLGICRGHQMINVCLGGTLCQDIPTEKPSDVIHHMEPPYDVSSHEITVTPNTILHDVSQSERMGVNSCHHQAIDKLASGLKVMGIADDGIIESVYMPDRNFVVGVQWHPEFSYLNEPLSLKLFREFCEAC